MEQLIVEHCAPTLAGLKTANLVNCRKENAAAALERCVASLKGKGIESAVLSERKDGALVYVYRRDRLQCDLSCGEAKRILESCGYKNCDVSECLEHLKKRIAEEKCFPHEIGLFLGYPAEDVKGFIEHRGKNFKCSGYWKVYCNECEAKKTFDRYKKCIDVYTRVYMQGSSIEKLTVAV